ncbi:MAG: B12-binding domain-containing radical SAM protein [Candidatus Muiribacteriaceae bacterium]
MSGVVFFYSGYESIGIEILSAVLKKNGINTSLVYHPGLFDDSLVSERNFSRHFFDPEKIARKILKRNPDLVGFSSMTDTFSKDIRIAEMVKQLEPSIRTVFGGIHPTVLYRELISDPSIDFIIRGEGEKSLLMLASGKDIHTIPGIVFETENGIYANPNLSPVKDLNKLPPPDKKIFYDEAPYFQDYYTAMTSRGCPYNCSFCNNNVYRKIYGSKYCLRRISPDKMISELRNALKKYRYRYVIFEDDAFVSDENWSVTFLTEYIKHIDRPFQCLINPRNISDKVAILLNKAGCRNVEIGIQSMEERLRRSVLNRSETTEEIRQAVHILNTHNIPFNIDHIGGIPGESHNNIKKAFIQYLKWRPNRITYFYLTYYPGTEISEKAIASGVLDEKTCNDLVKGESFSFEHGGNVSPKIRRFHDRIRTAGDWGVFFPVIFRKALKNRNLFRLIPRNHIIGRVIPAFLNILLGREVRGVFILRKYLYHLLRGGHDI